MTEQLPWDRYPTEPAPELPYVPPAPVPPIPPAGPAPVYPPIVIPPTPILLPEIPPRPPRPTPPAEIDWHEVLNYAWPAIREQAISYAKATVGEIRKGHTVDIAHPTITGETSTGRELVIADAKSRSWRTLVQGLLVDLFAALIAAVATLSGLDPFVKETWLFFAALVGKSFVSAGISFVMRLRVTPTIKVPGKEYAVMPMPRPIVNEGEELGP